MITVDIMRAMRPRGDSAVAGLIDGIVANAPAAFTEFGLDSPLVVAHAMAQFARKR